MYRQGTFYVTYFFTKEKHVRLSKRRKNVKQCSQTYRIQLNKPLDLSCIELERFTTFCRYHF